MKTSNAICSSSSSINSEKFGEKVCAKMMASFPKRSGYTEASLFLSICEVIGSKYPSFTQTIEKLDKINNDAPRTSNMMAILNDGKTLETIKNELEAQPELFGPNPVLGTSKLLGELLGLTDDEILFMDTAARIGQLGWGERQVLTSSKLLFDDIEEIYSILMDMPVSKVKKIITNSEIITMSIVVLYNDTKHGEGVRGYYCLNPIIQRIYANQCLTLADIDREMFPSMTNTTLEVSDYPYLKKPIDRVSGIINRHFKKPAKGTNILFWGTAGCGKTELAHALAHDNKWELKAVGDISEADGEEKSLRSRLLYLRMATKLFQNSKNVVILFDEMEDLYSEENNKLPKAYINRIIENAKVPIIWTTNSINVLGTPALRRMTYNIHFEIPEKKYRKGIWEKYAKLSKVKIAPQTIEKLAKNYEVPPASIDNAVKVIKATFGKKVVNDEEVFEIVGAMYKLINLGHEVKIAEEFKIQKSYDVHNSNTDIDLDSLTNKLIAAPNKGFSLCLYGAPGTGKSEYGRYLAHKMGKEVLFKRASDLISMWVGGTEQLIAEAFAEAKDNEMILLIDEGDSMLRDRGLARNSWEVTQVNEMLSQMERHPEPFILTTNLMKDIDPAALRRFSFKTEFKYVTKEQSRALFKNFFGMDSGDALDRIDTLAPGDFYNVRKQLDIMGDASMETIITMLKAEVAIKPNSRNPIGF